MRNPNLVPYVKDWIFNHKKSYIPWLRDFGGAGRVWCTVNPKPSLERSVADYLVGALNPKP